MPFKVSARMILELGAELISSDAVALYELIKNAIDAGSTEVEIWIQIVLRYSHFREAVEALEEGESVEKVRTRLLNNVEANAPAAARQAFRSSLLATDERAEFLECLRSLYHDQNWIMIRDRGHGMSKEDLDEIFLTIGTRSRRKEKVSDEGEFLNPGRAVLGDKGVGRLSAMRLADHMVVTTTQAGDSNFHVLDIDWRRFSHESAEMIGDIDISAVDGASKENSADKGTTILLRDVSGDWDTASFVRMIDQQFKRIVDPFPPQRDEIGWADPNLLFDLRFNNQRHRVPEIPQWMLEEAHAVVTATFDYDENGAARLHGNIDYPLRGAQTEFAKHEAELMSLTDPIADRLIRTGPKTLRDVGPFSVRFYWYNRRILTALDQYNLKRKDVLAAVNSWAGGLMVFRDHFRINPYGGLDDDWLELDKKALGAKSYKVNRSQIVGKVNLTSQNYHLVEQTNREGLAENEYKQVVVGVLRHILITEFRQYLNDVDRQRKLTEETTVEDLDKRIEEANSKIEIKLLELQREVPEQSERIWELQRLTTDLGRMIDQAKQMAREYEDDRAKFVHLAGIGLMVEFVLHEIGRTTLRAIDVVSEIDTDTLQSGEAATVRILEDQLKTLGKRVNNLDPLSTSRRQTKDDFDLCELIRQVVESRSTQLERHRIEVSVDLPSRAYRVRAVRGTVLQIIENLFENAVYWLKVEQRRTRGFHAAIDIELDAGAHELRFSDNGPGIAPDMSARVFEPFYTSKPAAQGRGLGLYISKEMAHYHDWELSLAQDQMNVDGRLSTFVLEMGGGGR